MYDQDLERAGASGAVAELCAKIDLHVGSVSKLSQAVAAASHRPPAQPVFGRTTASGLFVTGAPLVLQFNLQGPDQGHFWYVRSIAVGGLSPTVTAAGRADIFVSSSNLLSQASLGSIGLADWRDESIALPNIAFYGRSELPLRLNEKLFVVISNGTNAQQYVAACQFEDFEEGAVQEGWGL